MYIILGATGHVGAAVASTLLNQKQLVTIITRSSEKADAWKRNGANPALVDVHDVEKLKDIFSQGKRLFLLNPPAPPDTDTVAEEQKTLSCILKALEGSPIEKIVAE